jgi:hypothetical protein
MVAGGCWRETGLITVTANGAILTRADNGGVDIVGDYRARRMRKAGMSFRQIAAQTGTSLTRVRRSLRKTKGGRMRREVRAEIRKAGGLSGWWRR